MPVYIEAVILANFSLDYLIGLITLKITKTPKKRYRLFLAALLGTGAALGYPFVPKHAQFIINVILAPLIVLVMGWGKGIRRYIFSVLVFAGVTFAIGGAASAIGHLTGLNLVENFTLAVVGLGVLFISYIIRQARLFSLKKRVNVKKVKIKIFDENLELAALFDTGNSLTDSITAKPVVVLSRRIGERFENKAERDIAVKTVAGEARLKLLSADDFELEYGDGGKTSQFLIALSKEDYKGYDLILHSSFC